VGEGLLGRIIDGSGMPLDGRGPLAVRERWPLTGQTINPLARDPIRQPLDVGIRAINALLSVGRGQRLGLFAGSGVGKSVLLSNMARQDAQVPGRGFCVVDPHGDLIEEILCYIPKERARDVVVFNPADIERPMGLNLLEAHTNEEKCRPRTKREPPTHYLSYPNNRLSLLPSTHRTRGTTRCCTQQCTPLPLMVLTSECVTRFGLAIRR